MNGRLLAHWAVDVGIYQLLVAVAAALALAAFELADRGTLRGVPAGLWTIAPSLAALGAGLAVRRWQRTGAWVGVAACGVSAWNMAIAAGFAAACLAFAGSAATPAAPAPGTWSAVRIEDGPVVWKEAGGAHRVVWVRAGVIEGAAVDGSVGIPASVAEASRQPTAPSRHGGMATGSATFCWAALGVLAANRSGRLPQLLGLSILERVLAITMAVVIRQRGLAQGWEAMLPAVAFTALCCAKLAEGHLPVSRPVQGG